ncbi:uncharacterized protein LOC113466249 [Diaphorina citri]|uniref:Uncharacterized protein LOC113466249 n=1 Tax=Diaphorina citri TaxID=121845 RepID=A0A3Q0IM40_DIACI|nr:uncharacterized protein LOC113466249 [Diaphorina citri]
MNRRQLVLDGRRPKYIEDYQEPSPLSSIRRTKPGTLQSRDYHTLDNKPRKTTTTTIRAIQNQNKLDALCSLSKQTQGLNKEPTSQRRMARKRTDGHERRGNESERGVIGEIRGVRERRVGEGGGVRERKVGEGDSKRGVPRTIAPSFAASEGRTKVSGGRETIATSGEETKLAGRGGGKRRVRFDLAVHLRPRNREHRAGVSVTAGNTNISPATVKSFAPVGPGAGLNTVALLRAAKENEEELLYQVIATENLTDSEDVNACDNTGRVSDKWLCGILFTLHRLIPHGYL